MREEYFPVLVVDVCPFFLDLCVGRAVFLALFGWWRLFRVGLVGPFFHWLRGGFIDVPAFLGVIIHVAG